MFLKLSVVIKRIDERKRIYMIFATDDYLLDNKPARILFHDYAKDMPIFDYHNHLSAEDIYQHRRYDNLTQLWLEEDHYKWRAMRAMGVDEIYITGNAPEYEKYLKWVWTIERLPGNSLYHWTHLELNRYFGICEPLCLENALSIWERCAALLQEPGYDTLGLLNRMKVVALCTTDDPASTLEWHRELAKSYQGVKVIPTFRPDRYFYADSPGFSNAVEALEKRFHTKITQLEDLKSALQLALAHFQEAGCLLSDHAFIHFDYTRDGDAGTIFQAILDGKRPTQREMAVYTSNLLRFLAKEYHNRDIAMQLRFGTLRNNNVPMMRKWGPDGGFDSVGECTSPALLSALLSDLLTDDALPRTVLYCLNPGDNTMLSTMAVNFACEEVAGKVQFGCAWWFQDHIRGITNQINELMETGLLYSFIGMLTDSRSFTSFSRHEFFRRILCNILGSIIQRGEYPPDYEKMGAVVQNICYNNATNFLRLSL